jgi:hypothetical protein
MAKSSSRTGDGDSGQRNKIMLIASVVILVAAGGWFYMSRPKDLDAQVRDQMAAKRAENPQPAPTEAVPDEVTVPEGETTAEGTKTDEGQETTEAEAEQTPTAPKKKLKGRTGAAL